MLRDCHNKHLKSDVLNSFVWQLNKTEKICRNVQRALNDEKVLNVNEIRVWTPRLRFTDIIKREFR